MAGIRLVVHGRVQGVGFRYFVSQRARAYGIRGEVWNRSDGGVEVIAQHDSAEVLEAFASSMNEGPGRVAEVVREPYEGRERTSFDIGPSR
jgi:acylphosphatase